MVDRAMEASALTALWVCQHWLGGGFKRIAGVEGVGSGGSREEGEWGLLEVKEESVVEGGEREEGYAAELGVDIFISNEDFYRRKSPFPPTFCKCMKLKSHVCFQRTLFDIFRWPHLF